MAYLLICSVSFIASCLTFFSGFGLGTLLLPAFALFFQVERAVALTAVVHFLNGVFKLFLVWKYIDWKVTIRFGGPAILGALVGAWALLLLSGAEPVAAYTLGDRTFTVTPVKLTIGILLLMFAAAEGLPMFRRISFSSRFQPLGGLLSGFFGGLSGMQGALRSAFLVKAGLTKEAYVATGSAIAFFIDVSRLSIYSQLLIEHQAEFDYLLLAATVLAAFLGATLGARYLSKLTMGSVQALVAVMLFVIAAGLISGVL